MGNRHGGLSLVSAGLDARMRVERYNKMFNDRVMQELEGWWRVAGDFVGPILDLPRTPQRAAAFVCDYATFMKIRTQYPRYVQLMDWFEQCCSMRGEDDVPRKIKNIWKIVNINALTIDLEGRLGRLDLPNFIEGAKLFVF